MRETILKQFALAALFLLSATAGAAPNYVEYYGLQVCGVEVSSDNAANITGEDIRGGTVSYNAATSTLTLNNAEISWDDSYYAAIYNYSVLDGLTINVVGTSSITATSKCVETPQVDCNTTISGTGTLKLQSDWYSLYIAPHSTLTIAGDVTVECAGSVNGSFDDNFDATLVVSGNSTLKVDNPNGKKSGGTVNCLGAISLLDGIELLEPEGAYIGDFYYDNDEYDEHDYYGKCVLNSSGNLQAGGIVFGQPDSGIAIDEEHFPDENFRQFLLSQDYGADGVLTGKEIASVVGMDASRENIESLKGIEFFTALKTLNINQKKLQS